MMQVMKIRWKRVLTTIPCLWIASIYMFLMCLFNQKRLKVRAGKRSHM